LISSEDIIFGYNEGLKMATHKGLMLDVTGGWGFVERNYSLVRRYLGWEIYWLIYSTVAGVTIVLIGVTTGDKQLVLFLALGAILWEFLALIFEMVSEAVAWEMWEGTLELTFIAPLHRITFLLGNTLFAVIYGTIRSVLIMAAMAMFFKIDLSQADFIAAAVVLITAGLSFTGLGLAAAVLPILSRERGPQASHIIQASILLVSGVYYPIEVLPNWLQPFSVISPATYTLRAMRAAIIDGAGLSEVTRELIILLVIGVLLIPIGMLVFWLGERWAKKAGKLKIEG